MAKTPEQPVPVEVKPRGPWVTRVEAIVVLVLATLFLVWVVVIVVRQNRAGEGIEVIRGQADADPYLVDLNTADVQELMLLPGIGKVRSQRIIDWRKEHGAFTSLDQVRKATGLSANGIEKLKPYVRLATTGNDL